MMRGQAPSRRSGLEWAVRGGVALTFGVVGYFATTGTLAQVIRNVDIERAYRLAPYDARIRASLAQRLLADPQSSLADRRQGEALARSALKADPTAVAGVIALGLASQERTDALSARKIFAYADTLSRRELITQMWAIEDAVGRGDVDAVLRQYDIALRTSRASADLLFPILARAITDPAIRRTLARTLAAKPAWSDNFIDYVGTQGPDAIATANLFSTLHRIGVPVSEAAQGALINALLQKNEPDLAWQFFATMRPGEDRRRSRDPHFKASWTAPTPLDWGVVDVEGGSTSIQHTNGKSFFDFSLAASAGGALLQQVTLLPPGQYRLSGISRGINQAKDALPYWTMVCPGGREIGRVDLSNSSEASVAFSGIITVPEACSAQVLTLVARPSDAMSGVSGQIESAELAPLKGL
jgi:hypothetical protein